MPWYSFRQSQNYIYFRADIFYPFPAYKKKSHIIPLCPTQTNILNPHLWGFFRLTNSALFCFCENDQLIELALVRLVMSFSLAASITTYFEQFVIFIFWIILWNTINNMDIFSWLFISFIRHNISNLGIPALICRVLATHCNLEVSSYPSTYAC